MYPRCRKIHVAKLSRPRGLMTLVQHFDRHAEEPDILGPEQQTTHCHLEFLFPEFVPCGFSAELPDVGATTLYFGSC